MRKYTVQGEMTISVTVTVEAESEEEALDLAAIADKQESIPSPESFGYFSPTWRTSGELDGEPTSLVVVNVE